MVGKSNTIFYFLPVPGDIFNVNTAGTVSWDCVCIGIVNSAAFALIAKYKPSLIFGQS